MTDGCRSVRDGIFLYTLSLFYSAVVSLREGSSLSPVIMTGTTCHREGIVPPRRKVYIFAVVIRCVFCKADCSCRLWCGIAVRFRAVPLSADRGAHVARWTATTSAPKQWWGSQANIHRPYWLGRQGRCRPTPLGAAVPDGKGNQDGSFGFTSWAGFSAVLRLGGTGFMPPPPFLSPGFLGGVCCGSWLSLSA